MNPPTANVKQKKEKAGEEIEQNNTAFLGEKKVILIHLPLHTRDASYAPSLLPNSKELGDWIIQALQSILPHLLAKGFMI